MAYILSLLRETTRDGNESSLLEEEDDVSDTEDGDITMLNTEVTPSVCVCVCPSTDGSTAANTNTGLSFKALLQAIDVLKREVQRQREEKELLEANVREQVVCEMMEVINEMQDGFRCVCVCQASVIYILAFVTGSHHSVSV